MSKIRNTPYEDRALNQSYYTYDALYGPWNSFKEMVESVQETTVPDSYLNNFLKNVIPIGLTVGIIEDDKIVEYWNPIEGQGFVKKSSDTKIINTSSYIEALGYAIDENVGKMIYILDEDSDSEDDTGLYIITGNGKLKEITNSSSDAINIINGKIQTINNDIQTINNDIQNIESIIEEDEETTAESLNELNDRINNLTTSPITGIADNSKNLLNIDDDSKLEAKIGDLFDIDELADSDSSFDFDVDLGLCEAGNVYQYIEQIKNELISLMTSKKTGYFNLGPTISGSTNIGNILTVTSTPSTRGEVVYSWYLSDSKSNAENGIGTYIGTGEKLTIQSSYYQKYIYVVASFNENEEYTGASKKSNIVGEIDKSSVEFKFTTNPINKTYGDSSFVLSTNRITDTDDSSIIYSISDNTSGVLSGVNKHNGIVTLNNSYKVGSAVVNATISGSNTYNYNPSVATVTINVSKPIEYYWGMGDANIESTYINNGTFTLPVNHKTTSDKNIHITPYTFDGDETSSTSYYSWYVLVPKSTNLYIKENGANDVTLNDKKNDIVYIDNFGDEFDVYINVSPYAALSGGWMLDVTIN